MIGAVFGKIALPTLPNLFTLRLQSRYLNARSIKSGSVLMGLSINVQSVPPEGIVNLISFVDEFSPLQGLIREISSKNGVKLPE